MVLGPSNQGEEYDKGAFCRSLGHVRKIEKFKRRLESGLEPFEGRKRSKN